MAGLDRNTVSLLHFDDEAVQFDEITSNKWSSYGNASIDVNNKKFGGGSLKLNGGSYIKKDTALTMPVNDFTIEWWEYRTSTSGMPVVGTIGIQTKVSGNGLLFGYNEGANNLCYIGNDGGSWNVLAGFNLGTIDLNQWNHFAFVRQGNTFYGFKNGVLTSTATSSLALNALFNLLTVGVSYTLSDNFFYGNIDELRVSNVARWTSDFTPPTERYVVDANTVCLLHMEPQVFKDEKGLTWSATGMPQVSSTQSKFGGKSLYLNGSSYLKSNVGFNFGTSDFTIDFWAHPTAYITQSFPVIFDWISPTSANKTFAFHQQHCYWGGASGVVDMSAEVVSYNALPLNSWTHVGLVRKNGVMTYYFNGNAVASGNFTDSIDISYLCIGSNNGINVQGFFYGYIDELRISKGIARWTSNFTPPSRAYTFGGILFKNGSTFYGINSDKTLNNLGSPTTNDDRISLFKNNAMPQSMDNTIINLIKTNDLKVVAWDADADSNYNSAVAAVPKAQFVHEAFDIDLKLASYVDWVHVNDGVSNFETGNGKVRMVASRDSGSTWQTYNTTTSKWDTVLDTSNAADGAYNTVNTKRFIPSEDAMTRLLASGMNVTTFNAAPFNDFTLAAGYKTLRVGYILSIDSSSDIAMSDSLKYQYDGVGNWVLGANWTHYKVQTRNNSHTLTWLSPINGTRVKVNY